MNFATRTWYEDYGKKLTICPCHKDVLLDVKDLQRSYEVEDIIKDQQEKIEQLKLNAKEEAMKFAKMEKIQDDLNKLQKEKIEQMQINYQKQNKEMEELTLKLKSKQLLDVLRATKIQASSQDIHQPPHLKPEMKSEDNSAMEYQEFFTTDDQIEGASNQTPKLQPTETDASTKETAMDTSHQSVPIKNKLQPSEADASRDMPHPAKRARIDVR